jgi:DNA-binding IclR family transcriptional regulator
MEMPGLKLTLAQAARFFNLDRAECERVLAELVRAGELTTDGASFQLPGTCGTRD